MQYLLTRKFREDNDEHINQNMKTPMVNISLPDQGMS